MRRLSIRRTSLTVALCSLAAVLASPTANAAPAPALMSDPAQARALATEIGADRTGGVYYDDAGQLVVAVTDESAARTVRAEGGTAEVVKHSAADLASVQTALDDRIAEADPIPNTSWGIDPSTNQVSVKIFEGVSAADRKRLTDLVAGYGDAVRVEKYPGTLKTNAYESLGGIGIKSVDSGAECTLGFNVRNSSGQKYFVTAGHCADTSADLWWNREAGGIYLGKRTEWYDFGGIEKDYAVIKYNEDDNIDVAAYGAVRAAGTEYEITDSRYPFDGESVRRAGAVSSDLVGFVLSPSETVTVSGVVLKNMIMTTNCALGGDSGGPLWAGTDALGILSGGNTPNGEPCNSAQDKYVSVYQPVHWVLSHHGLSAF
ncbi:S1 family peptidase [Streptomyces adelaidensis]|uniref:S1 family peptidase n=1 Tax=Streptomyces adelaidensis TaxID=2796465 RepID=UPI001904EA64|nr:S1 family peptidase [Streptomyces adelaidensis]